MQFSVRGRARRLEWLHTSGRLCRFESGPARQSSLRAHPLRIGESPLSPDIQKLRTYDYTTSTGYLATRATYETEGVSMSASFGVPMTEDQVREFLTRARTALRVA